MSASDTLRTDAAISQYRSRGPLIQLARTLERELADRDATIARLREALESLAGQLQVAASLGSGLTAAQCLTRAINARAALNRNGA